MSHWAWEIVHGAAGRKVQFRDTQLLALRYACGKKFMYNQKCKPASESGHVRRLAASCGFDKV